MASYAADAEDTPVDRAKRTLAFASTTSSEAPTPAGPPLSPYRDPSANCDPSEAPTPTEQREVEGPRLTQPAGATTVQELMLSCVAGTAAAWRGAAHHGLEPPRDTVRFRYDESADCGGFLAPYVWRLARAHSREPGGGKPSWSSLSGSGTIS